eukprot:Hpha_TRINITY_DN9363_c0_g1::TRINITY_DN9363_c0_g1_i1::g.26084::m.26084
MTRVLNDIPRFIIVPSLWRELDLILTGDLGEEGLLPPVLRGASAEARRRSMISSRGVWAIIAAYCARTVLVSLLRSSSYRLARRSCTSTLTPSSWPCERKKLRGFFSKSSGAQPFRSSTRVLRGLLISVRGWPLSLTPPGCRPRLSSKFRSVMLHLILTSVLSSLPVNRSLTHPTSTWRMRLAEQRTARCRVGRGTAMVRRASHSIWVTPSGIVEPAIDRCVVGVAETALGPASLLRTDEGGGTELAPPNLCLWRTTSLRCQNPARLGSCEESYTIPFRFLNSSSLLHLSAQSQRPPSSGGSHPLGRGEDGLCKNACASSSFCRHAGDAGAGLSACLSVCLSARLSSFLCCGGF